MESIPGKRMNYDNERRNKNDIIKITKKNGQIIEKQEETKIHE